MHSSLCHPRVKFVQMIDSEVLVFYYRTTLWPFLQCFFWHFLEQCNNKNYLVAVRHWKTLSRWCFTRLSIHNNYTFVSGKNKDERERKNIIAPSTTVISEQLAPHRLAKLLCITHMAHQSMEIVLSLAIIDPVTNSVPSRVSWSEFSRYIHRISQVSHFLRERRGIDRSHGVVLKFTRTFPRWRFHPTETPSDKEMWESKWLDTRRVIFWFSKSSS